MPDAGSSRIDIRVPRIQKTFETLVKKLQELQQNGESADTQRAVIDWWIGKLFELRAEVRAGRRP
jgi:hypothetical protein